MQICDLEVQASGVEFGVQPGWRVMSFENVRLSTLCGWGRSPLSNCPDQTWRCICLHSMTGHIHPTGHGLTNWRQYLRPWVHEKTTPQSLSWGNAVCSVWSIMKAGGDEESWGHSKCNWILQAPGASLNPHCSMPGCWNTGGPLPPGPSISAVSTPLKMVGNLHLSENCLLTLISYF